jgi:hypothetical protein
MCPFKIIATVTYRAKKDKWVILLDNMRLVHNHDVAPEVSKMLAENRGIKDPLNEAKARSMVENKLVEIKRKPKAILQEMLACGENLTLRDAQNMVQAYKNEIKLEDDELAELPLFTAEDERNLVSVDETSKNETGVISLTSASMSGMASRFSEMFVLFLSLHEAFLSTRDRTAQARLLFHSRQSTTGMSLCCPFPAHLEPIWRPFADSFSLFLF